LNIKQFFENLNILKLSKLIEENKKLNNLKLIKIPKFEKKENIPLSFAQETLFFIHQIKNNGLYNMVGVYYFIGNLNINNFQKSFNLIIEKHDILRTKFKMENGKTFQIIKNELKFPINLLNFTKLNENEQKLKINEIIKNENKTGFDLTKLPLLKSYLIELIENKKYLLIFNIDHIIFDG
jgi:hypothetical protein